MLIKHDLWGIKIDNYDEEVSLLLKSGLHNNKYYLTKVIYPMVIQGYFYFLNYCGF
jgi:hypothetical protein